MDQVCSTSGEWRSIRLDNLGIVLWIVTFIVAVPPISSAQQSTAPPSSLRTIPLTSGSTDLNSLSSCDLCRKPEGRAGSDIKPHRPHHEKGLHPHKKLKGMHRSSSRSFRSLLPHYALGNLTTHESILNSWQIRVVDGDTFRYGLQRIRIRGIDAPELAEPGGMAAAKRLEELLKQGSVRMIPRGKDVYDRLVADVFVDGRNVAEMLAQEGYAKPRS